jgi:hypothetical protein
MDRNSDLEQVLAGLEQIRKAEDGAPPASSPKAIDASGRARRSDAPEVVIGLVEQRLNTLLTARLEQMMAEVKERLMTAVNARVADAVDRHLAAAQPVAAVEARSDKRRPPAPSGFTWRITDDD